MKGRNQYATPYWIKSIDNPLDGVQLRRVNFSAVAGADEKYDEGWLQGLVHRFPQSLPITELEPGISGCIPVGRELPTPSGPIDNVFVTTEGNIVLVECKLWRNPEARRKVISQIVDYAQSMSSWRYDDFDKAVRSSLDEAGNPLNKSLVELVGVSGDFDEAAFVDAINKNLRLGRMLLLVVGDGIREDTESLIEYLQMHAGFHFILGLIEFAVFKLPDLSYVVQPRVLARTLNIERAVVRIASSTIEALPIPQESVNSDRQTRRMSMTEEMFFEKLEAGSPEGAKLLRELLGRSEESGLGLYLAPATKSAAVKWEGPDGTAFNLGGIRVDGQFTTSAVCWVSGHQERLELAHEYLENISKLLGANVRKTPDPAQWYVAKNGTVNPSAVEILSRGKEWLELIKSYTRGLQRTMKDAG